MFFNFKNYECKSTKFSVEKECFFIDFFYAVIKWLVIVTQNFFVSLQSKQNNNTINNTSQ